MRAARCQQCGAPAERTWIGAVYMVRCPVRCSRVEGTGLTPMAGVRRWNREQAKYRLSEYRIRQAEMRVQQYLDDFKNLH